jgi:membrane protein implicated in regulation of membrane protease activity
MTLFGIDWSLGALWLAAALALAIAELIAPGFFMIFIAAGAALTGFVVLAIPGLSWIAQALLFAAFSAAAVAIGLRWYHRDRLAEPSHGLNDRTAKLIGKTVEVCEAIVAGEGRVKVGDGTWNATGPDAPAGALVRITGATGSVLSVELA